MDNLIKEVVEDFKKQRKKIEKECKKCNKETKIVFKSDEKGNVEVFAVSGQEQALLSAMCVILKEIEKYTDDSVEHMAKIILTTLEMEKEKNEWKKDIRRL